MRRQRQELYQIISKASIVATLPVSLQFSSLISVFAEYEAGYDAYFNRRGPGTNRVRAAGWLDAHRTEKAELEQRQEDRRSQF